MIAKKESRSSGINYSLVALAITAVIASFAVTDARAGLPLPPAPPVPRSLPAPPGVPAFPGVPAPPGVVVHGGGGSYGGHKLKKPKHKGHAYGHYKHKKHH